MVPGTVTQAERAPESALACSRRWHPRRRRDGARGRRKEAAQRAGTTGERLGGLELRLCPQGGDKFR